LQEKEICSFANAEIAELFGRGTYTSTVGDVISESGKWLAINKDNHAAQLRKNR
ncbi:3481_t:CDS:1, partial [Paraglomus brasilianum]